MTQEEIQKGYHDNCVVDTYAPEHLKCPAYYTHDGWMQGAEWMQKQMIDKACEWFRNEIDRGKGASVRAFFIDSVDRFRKAMEE